MITRIDELSDAELLAKTGVGHGRFRRLLPPSRRLGARGGARRTGSAEHASDLTAEVFASALLAAEKFRPERATASNWLFGILLKEARRV
ncbi:MAG: sigma factor [Solirubrobacteraceae bacterium]